MFSPRFRLCSDSAFRAGSSSRIAVWVEFDDCDRQEVGRVLGVSAGISSILGPKSRFSKLSIS